MWNEGLTFTGIAGSVLIAFKLSGVINWSWWFVLLPLYLSPLLLTLLVFAYIMEQGTEELLEKWEDMDDDYDI